MTAASVSSLFDNRHDARQSPGAWWAAIEWLRNNGFPGVAQHFLETAHRLGIIR